MSNNYVHTIDNEHMLLKANMCGQKLSYTKMVCSRESGSIACPHHAWQTRRYLVPFGHIHSETQWVGFNKPLKDINVLTLTSRYIVLMADSAFPGLPCFRVPDGTCLYAVDCNRRIIRLQKDDIIVRKKLQAGDKWPVHDANVLVRSDTEQHNISCLAFDRPSRRSIYQRLKSCFGQTDIPACIKALHIPFLKV